MPTPIMPAVFIGHGSPMNAIERNRYTETWRAFGASMPKPRAILMISATGEKAPKVLVDGYAYGSPSMTSFGVGVLCSPAAAGLPGTLPMGVAMRHPMERISEALGFVGAHPVRDALRHARRASRHRVRSYR